MDINENNIYRGYAEEQMGRKLTDDELQKIVDKIHKLNKGKIRHIREIPKVVEEALFELSSEVRGNEC